jgi:protoporphyrinogen oxidase
MVQFSGATQQEVREHREHGMARHELIVVGGGISGLSLAHFAHAQGRNVCVLEAEQRVGGALHSARFAADFWLELGAHTGYNSYGRTLAIVEALGLAGRLTRRETARWALWQDGRVQSIPSRLGWLELAASLPRLFTTPRAGATVEAYYGRVLGRRNFARVVRPMLSAVVSQDAAGIPAELLFKKRPRRTELPRSYAFAGGLQSLPEAIAALPGLTVRPGVAARRIEREGATWRVSTDAGEGLEAPVLALATPPDAAAALLADVAPPVAALLGRIATAGVQSEGVVVRAERVTLPRLAGLVGVEGPFWSVVTRDTVGHADFRGFAMHFRPGASPEQRLERLCAVLGIAPAHIEARISATRRLPSPAAGHAALISQVDAALAGQPLLLTGNWFGGLAIEDCVTRSAAEVGRLEGLR